MPLLKRNTIVAAKIETTPGTAVALTSSDAAFNVYDAKYTADIPMYERELQGSFSMLSSVAGARMARIEFSIDLYGSGTPGTPPAYANTFFVGCGMAVTSGVFSPVSEWSAMHALTMGMYEDGIFKSICGAMGTIKNIT